MKDQVLPSCGTAYVVVELHLSKAIRYMQEQDRHFRWPDSPWWSQPGNPRGFVARALSYHGLRGRLSVELCLDDGSVVPDPRWTGFTTRGK